MKKIAITCTLILTAFTLMAIIPGVSTAGQVKLTYSNFFPPTHI